MGTKGHFDMVPYMIVLIVQLTSFIKDELDFKWKLA